ncbi:hypothetical protein, partial [Ralstonia pseudosolanacearum]|uniref:hypothetical protein n=1 Tax=Ralstonia pseudosolanacearum TaxID=1310165 RepID=UPI00197CE0F9
RRNPVCLQRYRHVVARKRQHGLTTTLIYATTPQGNLAGSAIDVKQEIVKLLHAPLFCPIHQGKRWPNSCFTHGSAFAPFSERRYVPFRLGIAPQAAAAQYSTNARYQ